MASPATAAPVAATPNFDFYLFGGVEDDDKLLNEGVQYLTPDGKELETNECHHSEVARGWAAATRYNGTPFILGGQGQDGKAIDVVEKWNNTEEDPLERFFQLAPPLPAPRAALAAVTLGDRIFAIGGWSEHKEVPTKSVFVYDAKTDKWSSGPDTNFHHSYFRAVALNDNIYVLDGANGSEYYDSKSNTWAKLASPFPDKRTDAGCLAVGPDRILVLGGSLNGPTSGEVVDTVIEFKPSTGTFKTLSWKLPSARSGFAAFFDATSQLLYIVGGFPGDGVGEIWNGSVPADDAPIEWQQLKKGVKFVGNASC